MGCDPKQFPADAAYLFAFVSRVLVGEVRLRQFFETFFDGYDGLIDPLQNFFA